MHRAKAGPFAPPNRDWGYENRLEWQPEDYITMQLAELRTPPDPSVVGSCRGLPMREWLEPTTNRVRRIYLGTEYFEPALMHMPHAT